MDLAQLHGDEMPESCKKITVPWFKAFRVSPDFQSQRIQDYGGETFLLDAFAKHMTEVPDKKLTWSLLKLFPQWES